MEAPKEIAVDNPNTREKYQPHVQKINEGFPNLILIGRNGQSNIVGIGGDPIILTEALISAAFKDKQLMHVLILSVGTMVGATPEQIQHHLKSLNAEL